MNNMFSKPSGSPRQCSNYDSGDLFSMLLESPTALAAQHNSFGALLDPACQSQNGNGVLRHPSAGSADFSRQLNLAGMFGLNTLDHQSSIPLPGSLPGSLQPEQVLQASNGSQPSASAAGTPAAQGNSRLELSAEAPIISRQALSAAAAQVAAAAPAAASAAADDVVGQQLQDRKALREYPREPVPAFAIAAPGLSSLAVSAQQKPQQPTANVPDGFHTRHDQQSFQSDGLQKSSAVPHRPAQEPAVAGQLHGGGEPAGRFLAGSLLSSAWQAGTLAWAKVPRFPWWPAVVIPSSDSVEAAPLPAHADGHAPTLVRFLGTHDAAWVDSHKAVSGWDVHQHERSNKTKAAAFLRALKEARQYVASGALPDGFREAEQLAEVQEATDSNNAIVKQVEDSAVLVPDAVGFPDGPRQAAAPGTKPAQHAALAVHTAAAHPGPAGKNYTPAVPEVIENGAKSFVAFTSDLAEAQAHHKDAVLSPTLEAAAAAAAMAASPTSSADGGRKRPAGQRGRAAGFRRSKHAH